MADKRRNLGIPSGVVFPFAGTTAPYGYLVCDGSAVSRSDYPALFVSLGTSHGQGDGSTTFNLPDYRGRFMRGVDGVAGNDPDKASRTAIAAGGNTGNAVGSAQGHGFQTHTHAQDAPVHFTVNSGLSSASTVTNTTTATRGSAAGLGNYDYLMGNTASAADVGKSQSVTASNQNATATGANSQVTANETRPVNVNVNYIVKV